MTGKMSFSGEVKNELAGVIPAARHCQIAEIAAFVRAADLSLSEASSAGSAESFSTLGDALLLTDHESTVSLLFTLIERAYNIETVVSQEERRSPRGRQLVSVRFGSGKDAERVISAAMHDSILRQDCCKRAFLRGAFLAGGSVSSPEKSYHLEIATPHRAYAELIQGTMNRLGLDARTVVRKKDYVVYLKEGDQIVEFLGEIGASLSFLNIENVRILKEMRGDVNRRVNCETANLNKTIVSAVRQIEDIRYIRDTKGFGTLSPALREIAELRLAYPDASLAELGGMLEPKIGKSGVNHRLRKLGSIAAGLRGGSSETG